MSLVSGTIRLPDDSLEFIRDPADLVRVVGEHCGYDAAQMVAELARWTDKAEHLAQTDFEAYENTLDAAYAGLRDMRDMVGELRAETGKPRVNKAQISAILNRIDTEISNHI